ncbi:hypothetical protein LINPERHAP2_LOCUS26157 [Linum perenne]
MFGGPWMIGDHYVVLQNWRPYFRPESSSLSTLRVWVRLPGLPIEYFDATILKTIGDKIGSTVCIDHTTLQGNRGNFARICVEVDLSKPLLSKYRLRCRVRRIEYEGLHTICFSCGCYGHQQDECHAGNEAEDKAGVEVSFENPIFCHDDADADRPEVLEDFGLWMMVRRGAHRNRNQTSFPKAPVAAASPEPETKKGKESGESHEAHGKATPGEGSPKITAGKDSYPIGQQAVNGKENVVPVDGAPNGNKGDVALVDEVVTPEPTPRPSKQMGLKADEEPKVVPGSKHSMGRSSGSGQANSELPQASTEGKGLPGKVRAKAGNQILSSGPAGAIRKKSGKGGAKSPPDGWKAKGATGHQVPEQNQFLVLSGMDMEVDSISNVVFQSMEQSDSMERV